MKNRLGWLTPEEAAAVAAELGVDVEDVYKMENRLNNPDMALEAHGEDDGDDRESHAPIHYLQQEGGDPALLIEHSEWENRQQEKLQEAIGQLDERSRDIVASRWLSEDKLTLHDLAARYNVSAERIRQLESSAMKKLRNALADAA